ncbi:MAG: sugar ABC transporter permease [Litorilinea sp.]|nr:MAG: sugar ABC transporter permease [Litorilinea sp.]
MIFPFLWMLSTALKTPPQLLAFPPILLPSPMDWSNFGTALQTLPFGIFLRNTLIIEVAVIVGGLISNTMVAYGFARLRFPGREFLFFLVISTIIIPWMVRLVPLYLIFNKLGWVNTFLPLIVPAYFGTPFYIFLLRQFFRSIPNDLSDAARIDGAGEFQILIRLILPLSKPVLAAMVIFTFQDVWDDFVYPLVFLHDQRLKTVALGLYDFVSIDPFATPWHLLMAASVLVVLPVLCLFAAFQRFFIQGITLTGVKG